jgi:hypothetical protein
MEVMITPRSPRKIDVRRRHEPRPTTVLRARVDPPPSLMDDGVVPPAQQDSVGKVGRAAFGPRCDVVRLAPAGGYVTSGECAPSVPGDQCASLHAREQPLPAPLVEDGAVIADHLPDQNPVAGEQIRGMGRGRVAVIKPGAGPRAGGRTRIIASGAW